MVYMCCITVVILSGSFEDLCDVLEFGLELVCRSNHIHAIYILCIDAWASTHKL